MSSEDQDISGDSDLESEKKSSLDEGEDEMENQAEPSTSNGTNFKNPDASAKGDESSEASGDDDDDDDSDDSDDSDESDDGDEERDDENRFLPEVKLPKTITCDESVMSLKFHPKGNMLAAGLMDGSITLYSYSAEEPNEELMFEEVHKKACRAIAFSEDGKSIFSVSKDKSVSKLDVATASVELSLEMAHEAPIYCLAVVDENLVATGDDDGHLKVWDLRTQKAIMEMKENEEFISSLVVGKDKKILLATRVTNISANIILRMIFQ
ncbi:WD repeat-containing protein 55-like [Lytechinus pictus]|uniref:WD repeat-containing protein 55-like n=1 Tax=Lytechinus pictus TaxID=7653 RepID=UPI0030BA1E8D